jgi:hypothetical protein
MQVEHLSRLISCSLASLSGGLLCEVNGTSRPAVIRAMVSHLNTGEAQSVIGTWTPNRTVMAFVSHNGEEIMYLHNNPTPHAETRRYTFKPRKELSRLHPAVFFPESVSREEVACLNDHTLPFLPVPPDSDESIEGDWATTIKTRAFDHILETQYPTQGANLTLQQKNRNAITQRLYMAFMGRLLQDTRYADNWQRMAITLGAKRIGKSSLVGMLKRWFPKERVFTLDMGGDPNYGLDGMQNAWLILMDELKGFKFTTDQLLQAIAGNSINIGRKHVAEARLDRLLAHLVAFGNPPFPAIADPEGALLRRLLAFMWPNNVQQEYMGDLETDLLNEAGHVALKCSKAYFALQEQIKRDQKKATAYSDGALNDFLAINAPWLLTDTETALNASNLFVRYIQPGSLFARDPEVDKPGFRELNFGDMMPHEARAWAFKMPWQMFLSQVTTKLINAPRGMHHGGHMTPKDIRERLAREGYRFGSWAEPLPWPFDFPGANTYTGEWIMGLTIQRNVTELMVTPEIKADMQYARQHADLDPVLKALAKMGRNNRDPQQILMRAAAAEQVSTAHVRRRMTAQQKEKYDSIKEFALPESIATFTALEPVTAETSMADIQKITDQIRGFMKMRDELKTALILRPEEVSAIGNHLGQLYKYYETAFYEAQRRQADAEGAQPADD